ncbi:galactose oxidase [Segetibacter aerophilus]|uniref:galactose oxidase n=1 Tax=Segetibacter aerophilus TaxID=670293 RepID=UPI0011BEB872|nr:galactose oxidase [Segetibacter aerophilus]
MLLGFLFTSVIAYEQSHGLQFSSHEVVPEKRTSLNLTPTDPICLTDDTEISFDFNFAPNFETYFGYIIRIITNNNQNIDIVYNQKLLNFNFVIGENFSFVFRIDQSRLYNNWNHCSIRFNKKSQEVLFYLDNQLVCRQKFNFSEATCSRVFFGANDYEGFKTIDIPPMRIKDIKVKQGNSEKSFYPLAEILGNQTLDAVGKSIATVKNPTWIKPRHQNWQQVRSIATAATASIAFDKNSEVLYIVSTDSLYQLSLKNGQISGVKLSKSHGVLPPGNQSVFNQAASQLYNFYVDEKEVSTYLPNSQVWSHNFNPKQLTEFWQANKFISTVDSSLYVVAGYGQLQYKSLVQRYSFPNSSWEVVKAKGDFFMPRYLAALGTNAATDTAFIIGGYGSNTGDQTINPKYNYDLIAYSVRNSSFKKIYHLNDPAKQFCFANSLVIIPGTTDFYSLIYPIDRFNSSIQLIKGSLTTPAYELVGDSIPYAYHDIESFADLFYCPASQKLVAVTLFSSKDNITSVKVFTLDFPPNPFTAAKEASGKKPPYLLYALIAVVVLIAGRLIRKRRKQKVATSAPTEEAPVISTAASNQPAVIQPASPAQEIVVDVPLHYAVYLFGQFEVIDKNGADITRQFTPLVKELFLLLLVYTFRDGKGISSEKLYEMLWSDKSAKDARNNFSVNIIKLKGILDKVGEYHIGKETGKWKFEVLNESIRIDYQHFTEMVAKKQQLDKKYIHDLQNMIDRGSFLSETQYDWLDDIKSEVTSFVVDTTLQYLSTADVQMEAEWIIKLTNSIFHFDQLNEDALAYKCRSLIVLGRHGMAKDAYLKFAKEYKETYGQDFEKSFAAITGH